MSEGSTKPRILITGCSGLIGSRLVDRLADEYSIVGFDVKPSEEPQTPKIDWVKCDLTDSESVANAIDECRERFGDHFASVIHLAAYYDFSGERSPLYDDLTVEGTRRLLQNLHELQVEQFVFSSSLLVMESVEEGHVLNEESETDAEWAYPKSKLRAEQVIREERGQIPTVVLRISGVYDEMCHSLPISQQISRIYEKQMESYFFPGDKSHGQAFVHLSDLAECIHRVVAERQRFDGYETFLIAEEDVMSYEELQDELGTLIHGSEWPAIRIPKPLAKAGAWVKDKLSGDEDGPFIKPWMIDLADQNYPVDIQKARQRIGWIPKNTLRATLPQIIANLHHDPERWYDVNGLPQPDKVKT